ncbi:hypothetical protein KC352_g71 [Hortaea werneckii]|nr:hypothetical protein KC352_g71 [Hortaea werneckii]
MLPRWLACAGDGVKKRLGKDDGGSYRSQTSSWPSNGSSSSSVGGSFSRVEGIVVRPVKETTSKVGGIDSSNHNFCLRAKVLACIIIRTHLDAAPSKGNWYHNSKYPAGYLTLIKNTIIKFENRSVNNCLRKKCKTTLNFNTWKRRSFQIGLRAARQRTE